MQLSTKNAMITFHILFLYNNDVSSSSLTIVGFFSCFRWTSRHCSRFHSSLSAIGFCADVTPLLRDFRQTARWIKSQCFFLFLLTEVHGDCCSDEACCRSFDCWGSFTGTWNQLSRADSGKRQSYCRATVTLNWNRVIYYNCCPIWGTGVSITSLTKSQSFHTMG